ncbi:MAG: type II toxin-antitoxin system HicB family antitoxin [Methanocellales archaeon]|jgi:predicted RNase H-like HicB family nuclease|nr:type II toxin-antitoxin system HicB family antitoxin [Methanocellales archaeon]
MKLKVVLEPAEEGGYTVYVPSLPGCISEGDSREEALENIKEAISLYLEPDEEKLALKQKGMQVVEVAV